MSTDLARETGGPLGQIGQAYYFHPDTLARGKELGLDGFRWYMLGRGGVLGDVDAAVVQSAFGYFHGELLANIWSSAKERMDPRQAASEYMECARELGRKLFADVEGLDGFCEAAEAVVNAIDPSALSLYAGTAAEPLCDDIPGRAMQLAVVLREWRGSVHLVAIVAEGLAVDRAHYVKRPNDYAMFGYQDDPAPATDEERRAHAAAEDRTNHLCGLTLSVLTDEQAAAYSAGVAAMHAALPS